MPEARAVTSAIVVNVRRRVRLDGPMSTDGPFPDVVPVLVDPAAGVLLRAHTGRPTSPGIIEQCRDPETIRWTTVSHPGGRLRRDRGASLPEQDPVRLGGRRTVRLGGRAARGEGRDPIPFAGSIDLHPREPELFSVGFGLHPAARGRPGDDLGAAPRP